MIKRFYELQERVLSYHAAANIELLKKAYAVATDAHLNQLRASKEPYIIHPLAVAAVLADMRLDEISVAAGLLHDVLEDSSYTRDDLTRLFGKEISDLVWGVTKISKISEVDVEDAQAETLKKMIIAMTADVRVILIKLADRLHNVRTLGHLAEEKRHKIAKETMEIYAPIAYRLGMGKIRDELEDISFMYLYPEDFQRIKSEVGGKYDWAIQQLEGMKTEIEKILREYNIPADIQYRIKREISIYRKLKRQNIDLEKVYDLMALRVITDTVANCYAIMGGIHQRWTHIPARWRDFITNPKSNFYQSIHTTIITHAGVKFEIQIRTAEMHHNAEEGIAAHWKYKEGLAFLEHDNRLQWFREMIEYHKTNPDPKEFLSLVKRDLTPNEIYVFTPKGKVVNLEAGASALDFAYAIHSEVGDHCKSAVVNEKLVPIKTKLNSGDVVDIVTNKGNWPSQDWLKYVITSRAKKRIMGYLQRQESQTNTERGQRQFHRVLREYQKKHRLHFKDEEIDARLAELHYPDRESFYRDIGSGKKTMDRDFLKNLFPDLSVVEIKPARKPARHAGDDFHLVTVEGLPDIDFTFARCCTPIKGEEIVGYMTSHRGLVVHRRNCPNINLQLTPRIKQVAWVEDQEHAYQVLIELTVADKPGVLSGVTAVPAAHGSNIRNIDLEQVSQATTKIRMVFDVKDTHQLQVISDNLRTTPDVYALVRRKVVRR
jgi:GTP diphosphokinase / guanosine-3',5'-bis(diphosphate) 3'-diphosphatase